MIAACNGALYQGRMNAIVYIVTALIVAYLGAAAHVMVKDGHYWVLLALPIFALWLGWVVGDEADKQSYRDARRWIMDRFLRRQRADDHLQELPEPLPLEPEPQPLSLACRAHTGEDQQQMHRALLPEPPAYAPHRQRSPHVLH